MDKKVKEGVGYGLGLGSIGVLIVSMTPEAMVGHFTNITESKVAQFGFFFTLAAWIHSGRVKKEIAAQFTTITEAINNVATALHNDLAAHGSRLDNLTNRVDKLEQTKGEKNETI